MFRKGFTLVELVVVVAIILILGALIASTVGCEAGGAKPATKADVAQAEITEQRLEQAMSEVGMPDVINFTELKLARDIMELRDQEGLTTFTYVVNWEGELVFIGESIGYGLPYSVQLTNPEKTEKHNTTHFETHLQYLNKPQAEPNGLFMPEGLAATWILLKDPNGGEVHPVYIESEILVSPFRLH